MLVQMGEFNEIEENHEMLKDLFELHATLKRAREDIEGPVLMPLPAKKNTPQKLPKLSRSLTMQQLQNWRFQWALGKTLTLKEIQMGEQFESLEKDVRKLSVT